MKYRIKKQLNSIRNRFGYNAILPVVILALIALSCYTAIHQAQALTQTTIAAYQQTELEIVRAVARSVTEYVSHQMQVHNSSNLNKFEQEIFKRFIVPIRLLENGDAWIWTPDHVIFDQSADFPDLYRGKSMAEVFALQAEKGANHYQEMTDAVMNGREGVGWYIWLPDKGREIAAWSPARVGDLMWTIGLSTPLIEILEATGTAAQIRILKVTTGLGTIVALLLLAVWWIGAVKRLRMEEALRKSEEKYRFLFENASVGIIISTPAGQVLGINKAIERITGYSDTEMLKNPTSVYYVNSEDRTRFIDALKKHGHVENMEMNMFNKAREKFWGSFSAKSIDFENQAAILTSVLDITERKRTERELLKTKDMLEQTSRMARVGGWEKNLLTGEDHWSAMTKEIHEVPDDFVPDVQNAINFYKEGPNRDKIINVVTRAIKQCEPFDVELQILTAKGNERWIRAIGHPKFQDGQCVHLYGTFQDIDDQVNADRALQESETKLNTLVHNIPGMVYRGFTDWSAEIINGSQELCGYSAEELNSKEANWLSIIHPDDKESMFSTGSELRKSKINIIQTYRIITKEGDIRWVEDRKVSLFSDDGEFLGIDGIVFDITKRKKTEEQIKASLREKETLLQEIHHRVKNNLAIVSSLLSFQSKITPNEQARAAFQESQNRIRAMARIHEHLYQSADLAQIDMAQYVRGVVNQLRRTYGAGTITFQVEITDVILDIDSAMPCGLIINELVSNAFKYAFPPEWQKLENEPKLVRVDMYSDDGQCVLTVSDNGVGLPADLQIENVERESLGLRLVNMLCEQLEGALQVSSEGGAAFCITFTYAKNSNIGCASET